MSRQPSVGRRTTDATDTNTKQGWAADDVSERHQCQAGDAGLSLQAAQNLPVQQVDITGLSGVTEVQRAALLAMGAVEQGASTVTALR